MKKIMFALMCIVGCMTAFADSTVITNVYDFKAILRVPYVYNGIRTYQSQTLKGYLFTEIADGQSTAMWLELVNAKTKIAHVVEFNSGFYYLMGKTSTASLRTVPTVYYEANDIDIGEEDSHEFISKIQFAGTGSLKSMKTVTKGCAACGVPFKTVEYCNILYKMNGYATGVMDCLCPDDEEGWWHTVQTALCGVYVNDGDVERKHDAAVWGTWTATFNKKLSDTKIK